MSDIKLKHQRSHPIKKPRTRKAAGASVEGRARAKKGGDRSRVGGSPAGVEIRSSRGMASESMFRKVVQSVDVHAGIVSVVRRRDDPGSDHARLGARVRGILHEFIGELSPAAVGRALEAPGPVSAIGVILDELIKERPDLVDLDPVGEAAARIASIRQGLVNRAGGAHTTAKVAEILGTSPGAVRKRIQRGTLMAFQTASGEHRLPAAQFEGRETIQGLEDVLAAMHVSDPWMRIQLFLDDDVLGSLQRGMVGDAVQAVRSYLPEDEGEPL